MKYRDTFDHGRYILIDRTPVPEPDIYKWGEWYEHNERRVALTRVGPYEVSTVFLGLDHRFGRAGPPLLFETMVFLPEMLEEIRFEGKSLGHYRESLDIQERCSTWAEAEAQHARVVQELLAQEPGDPVVDLKETG